MMFAGAARRALAAVPSRAAVLLPKTAGACPTAAPVLQLPTATAVHQWFVRCFAAGKPKTHSGAKKRFKVTASGRVKYAQYVVAAPAPLGGRVRAGQRRFLAAHTYTFAVVLTAVPDHALIRLVRPCS